MDSNYDPQMYLSKSKCWYSNNCLHFLKHAVPFIIGHFSPFEIHGTAHFENGYIICLISAIRISGCLLLTLTLEFPEAGLLTRSSCLSTALDVTIFTNVRDMILVPLCGHT
jgi:hypothetical protein